ncbi:hypothetical protein AMS68_005873 [Peltaster fructicola]|uniref:RRM domain-containing protein n=1 Tax=Peltaster fructicola TaxID=286661 RepID=A0A6H0Y091_9PEZI|nr:hypothetical protein AMS68_005873 [Peltaster fructicola]
MQSDSTPTTGLGHRHTQSFAAKPSSLGSKPFSLHGSQQSVSVLPERLAHRAQMPSINTSRNITQPAAYNTDLQSPQTAYDMNFTPLLPSQLLMGSPFQPGSPTTFQSPQFQSFAPFLSQNNRGHQGISSFPPPQQSAYPTAPYPTMASPTALGASSYFNGLQSPTTGFNAVAGGAVGSFNHNYGLAGAAPGTSRTVYLGNIPPDTSAEEILSHVRSGQIESVRLLPDKNCAFISFLDASSATHFHSDAILKKLSIKGQDIKIGWGKPSAVPTSVGLAVQQNGASRNVYLGNIPEELSEAEIREELSKFGPIDTVKIVREKAIGFVHFLSIGNAIKAVTQLPQDPKWQTPRRVYYGKDRCAYVSKTQQQNAAQYLGIAPGYAHMLNGADRELITNVLAQQSVAAAAVATTVGGANNLGNRTVYLGNIHPETTIEEICNVVRGGLLHHIRYIPDKHICFVTFIDPTSAAGFFASSTMQGLMIHNRRLKIGWGKHSGALPPAIALAVSGGASRNVYIGNLDESWSEDRLRADFQDYGEIELVNALREKSCAFVNFTNIANAIKAIEAVRGKEDYKRFKVNFGKDRCGNPPRQMNNAQHQHQQQPQQQHQHQQREQAQSTQGAQQQGSEGGVQSPSPVHSLQANRIQNSISPASGISVNGGYNQFSGPTASAILNAGSNNPLTMFLAVAHQNAHAQVQQTGTPPDYAGQSYLTAVSQPTTVASTLASQNAFYSSPNEVTTSRSSAYEPITQHHYGHGSHQSVHLTNGHGSHQSINIANGQVPMGMYSSQASQARASHNRAASLPAFNLQAQQAGLVNGLAGLGSGVGGYGLGVSNEPTLPGWAEEETV